MNTKLAEGTKALVRAIRSLEFNLEGSLQDIEIAREVMNEFPVGSQNWNEARDALHYHERFARDIKGQLRDLYHELNTITGISRGGKKKKR